MSVRAAVREDLEQLAPGDLVLVACSGGADSVALALAAIDEAQNYAIRIGVISIDHGLQAGSKERAEEIVKQMRERGADPAEAISVSVGRDGGLEAAARSARYEALDQAAAKYGATAVYLGHTASDQAETVILGLLRGSGARSLSGMARVNGIYRRPLLDLSREEVRAEAESFGFPIWDDPYNEDETFTRVRIRTMLIEMKERISPSIENALVKSAGLLRDDADALDAIADEFYSKVASESTLDLVALMDFPRAVRTRMIKRFARESGLPQLTAEHIDSIEALASKWKGQGPVALPGHCDAAREGGRLTLRPRP